MTTKAEPTAEQKTRRATRELLQAMSFGLMVELPGGLPVKRVRSGASSVWIVGTDALRLHEAEAALFGKLGELRAALNPSTVRPRHAGNPAAVQEEQELAALRKLLEELAARAQDAVQQLELNGQIPVEDSWMWDTAREAERRAAAARSLRRLRQAQ